ncbi:MAG: cupredoxin domain-containing protein [Acidimicrobiia bacterium]
MKSRCAAIVAALILLAPALVLVARPAAARVPSGGTVVTVHVRDNVFRPSRLGVKPGTTVRWVNEGRNRHNVTPNSGDAFGSKNLSPGQSYAFRFEDAGKFSYYCTLHGAPGKGQHATLAVGDDVGASDVAPTGSGDSPAPSIASSGRTIRVPADAKTIQGGVDRAKPGDLVLVSPGVYHETVTIATKGIVLRGLDRNRTILDGDFERENGVKVVGADGVAIENLTARNYTENGFYWDGVRGYRGSYLTAYRNGDYGIFSYDSQWGVFDNSYASGSPDAGFYIGQCNPCHAVITDVVSEFNQLGYSGTNAGGDLFIVRSVWRKNRTGIVPNTLDSEELPPQRGATIAGNLVELNGSTDAARSSTEEFDVLYGGGIVLVGASDNKVLRNHAPGNAVIGIAIAPNPALQQNFWPSTGNEVRGNDVQGSSLADLAVILATPADGNCFADNQYGTSAPKNLEQLMPCDGAGTGDPSDGALLITRFLDTSNNPTGRDYKKTPVPPEQQNMANAKNAKARPAGAPPKVDLASVARPS